MFNGLNTLPSILPDSLEVLNCSINNLNTLPRLPNSLNELIVNNNLISNIPNLPPNLEILDCTNNSLTSLPAFPDSLRQLYCRGNQLDEETISRVIQFYQKAIENNYPVIPNHPTFKEELDFFSTRTSITTSYALKNQDVDIGYDNDNMIREFAGLRSRNISGGKKKTLKKRKNKRKRKTLNKRKRKSLKKRY